MAKHMTVFAFVAVLGSLVGCGDVARGFVDKSVELELVQVANELNKNAPMMVDQETRLDTTMAGPGKKLTYHYTLVNLTTEDIDIGELRAFMTTQIVNHVATHSDMQTLRDHRVTFAYSYKDKNGVHLTTIQVTPKDYGK